jgi:hypothetical protein
MTSYPVECPQMDLLDVLLLLIRLGIWMLGKKATEMKCPSHTSDKVAHTISVMDTQPLLKVMSTVRYSFYLWKQVTQ